MKFSVSTLKVLSRPARRASSTLDHVDWNAHLLRGDLQQAVQQLKHQPGKGLFLGGVTLPQAPRRTRPDRRVQLHRSPQNSRATPPTLFSGLSKPLDLNLLSQRKFASGAVAMRYEPRR